MILGGERHIGKRMMDGLEYFKPHTGMLVQLSRLFCIDPVWSVNDLSLDGQLAYVMQVTGDGGPLGLVRSPADL